MSDETKVVEQFKKYSDLLLRFSEDHRKSSIEKFLSKYETRLAVSPSSTKLEYHGCYAGGLIDHSLSVLSIANKLQKTYKELDLNIEGNLCLCALLHDVGKLGTIHKERFVVNSEEWSIKKYGLLYSTVEGLPPVHHCTMMILQDCGIALTEEEHQAILLASVGPWSLDEMKPYSFKENNLSLLLMQADRISIQIKK